MVAYIIKFFQLTRTKKLKRSSDSQVFSQIKVFSATSTTQSRANQFFRLTKLEDSDALFVLEFVGFNVGYHLIFNLRLNAF